jgi:hypothetical protein
LSKTLWVKGVSGNPKGRPAGSKDKKWASLDYWFGLVMNEWDDLKPSERAHIGIEAWKALLSGKHKKEAGEEFIRDIKAAATMLEYLQEMRKLGIDPRIGAGRDTVSLENGRPTPQVIETTAQSI